MLATLSTILTSYIPALSSDTYPVAYPKEYQTGNFTFTPLAQQHMSELHLSPEDIKTLIKSGNSDENGVHILINKEKNGTFQILNIYRRDS